MHFKALIALEWTPGVRFCLQSNTLGPAPLIAGVRLSRQRMNTVIKLMAMFALCMVGCMIVCVAIWQGLVTDRLYHRTDSLGFDFVRPGNWVHGVGTPYGDTIKDGWSLTGLWCLWYSSLVTAILVSGLVTL
jgi:hypothetical protein